MTMTLLPQSPQTSPEVLVLSPGRLWVRSYQGPLSTAPLQVHAAPARLRQAPCDAHLLQSCACDCSPAHCPEGHGRGLEIVPITQSWRGTGSKQGFDHPFHSFGSERHIMSPLKKMESSAFCQHFPSILAGFCGPQRQRAVSGEDHCSSLGPWPVPLHPLQSLSCERFHSTQVQTRVSPWFRTGSGVGGSC